ncbi:protein-glutamate methylesterase/protein-glutamine glutaminase [Rubripirellula reticaptiva]|uniref:Protein-glutamate methylesterase/protein-glutamine glutaminase n=1 Tax=Rubripirellula reticaptiva TaxID=2528013 RepID=A0A5C6EW86_9BACT|nr:chemotaxis response regulator protein-glutamate methylesterase [Rubripirellula reticaptiva]TWU51936.1 Chemotaxis response regulator protein-glutamate methylesterase [Rubripirellula reticaptiva]
MRKIRVLVVDDSTVIRRLLSDSLAADPQIEVCGIAANGKIALAKIPQLNPDILTLDMEMPEMDGITTLVELRKLYPKLPVIMFSTLTQRGAVATMDALAKGANDYVTKPANVGSVTAAMQQVRDELVPRIKAFCPHVAAAPAATAPSLPRRTPSRPVGLPARVDAVAIGSSTGGPNALQTVLTQLSADFPVPVLIVQHMPPVFTKHLADRLNHLSALSVFEASPGDTIQPGGVWIAPGDFHMRIQRVGTEIKTKLDQETPENSCRPAVDVLFRSASEIYGPNLLTVVLTGMGQDGARGSEAVCQAGGKVIIQDQATSVVWGMPGAVSRLGIEDATLPLERIAAEIQRRSALGRTAIGRQMACQ